MKKRLVTLILALIMCAGLLPTQAFARLGSSDHVNTAGTAVLEFTISSFNSTFSNDPYTGYPEGTYYILYNDYITFVLWPDGSSTTSSTVRMKELIQTAQVGPIKSIDEARRMGLYRTERHDFAWCFEDWALTNDVLSTPSQMMRNKDRFLPVGKHKNVADIKTNGPRTRTLDGVAKHTLSATYKTNQWSGDIIYSIVKLGDDGRTWGVRADSDLVESYNDWEALKPKNKQNYNRLMDQIEMHPNGYPIVMITEHFDFAQPGGSGTSYGIPWHSTFHVNYGENWWEISANTVETKKSDYVGPVSIYDSGMLTEVYTKAFSSDRQFVALGNYFFGGQYSGAVEGHNSTELTESGKKRYIGGSTYGDYYAYQKQTFAKTKDNYSNTLIVYSLNGFTSPFDANDRSRTGHSNLWGFRQMYSAGLSIPNIEVPPADPDYTFEVPGGSKYLGIVRDGNYLTVKPAKNQKELEKNHGSNLVAVFRGEFAVDNKTGEYTFLDGKAALSTNITASWGSKGYFKVSRNGDILVKGVTLSCPAFDFFVPKDKNSTSDLRFFADRYDSEGDLISGTGSKKFYIGFKSGANKCHLAVDIPGFTTEFNGVTVSLNGDVEFDGSLDISLPLMENVAGARLDTLAMGNKTSKITKKTRFGVTKIKGGGQVGFPEFFSLEVPGAKAAAEINYDYRNPRDSQFEFELSLSVPNLFALDVELGLKGLDNGWIFPDKVIVAGESKQGVDITPATPVASLTGLKGGIDGLADSVNALADTINGNFMALPPFRLILGAKAELIKIFGGWADVIVGLGYVGTEVRDPSIMGVNIGSASYKQELYVTLRGENYEGKKYVGVAFGGGNHLDFKFPSSATDILVVDAGIKADVFGGIADWGKNLYLAVNASGWAKGNIQIPNGTVAGIDIPKKIRGEKLFGREIWASISGKASTSFSGKKISDAAKELMSSTTVDATLSYSGTILSRPYWIKALFKNKVIDMGYDGWVIDFDTKIPFGTGVRSRNLMRSAGNDVMSFSYTPDAVLLASTSKSSALRGPGGSHVDAGLENVVTIVSQSGSKHIVTIDGKKLGDGVLHFQLKPNSKISENDILALFKITDERGNVLKLEEEIYPTNAEGNITSLEAINAGTANAYVFEQVEKANDEQQALLNPVVKEGYHGVTVMLPENSSGTWTFETVDGTEFEIEALGFAKAPKITDADSKGNVVYANLGENKEYLVDLCYVDEEGLYRIVSTQEFTGLKPATKFDLPTNLISMPSGDYEVRFMLRIKTGETTFVVDEFKLPGKITNNNPDDIPAPTGVTLETAGSETLRAFWTAPSGFDPDGYAVTVYQKVGDEWVSTGAVYHVKKDKNGMLPTSLDMALTLHGVNGSYSESEGDENITADPKKQGMLDAEQNYRVGVQTLKNAKLEYTENNVAKSEVFSSKSAEVLSNEKVLPKAIYPTLSYEPEPIKDDSIKTAYVKPGVTKFIVTADQPVKYHITVMNDPSVVLFEHVGDETYGCEFTVPDFVGSMMIKIEAVNENGDKVTDVMQLWVDEVAPVVSLDSDSFKSNSDGTFTITGSTELSADVSIAGAREYEQVLDLEEIQPLKGKMISGTHYDWAANPTFYWVYKPELTVTREPDGSFTISGQLINGFESMGADLLVIATDEAGNIGGAMANVGPNANTESDPHNVSVSKNEGGSVTLGSTTAKAGETVSFTVKPDEGYEIASVGVSGVSVTAGQNGEYSFIMPAREVTVEVRFRSKGTQGGDPAHDCPSDKYKDVNTALWYHEYIDYVVENGLMVGTAPELFEPESPTSRAMIVAILYRLEGRPAVQGESPFHDVKKGEWYHDAVLWANANGIVAGHGDGRFAPDENITREQLAAILYRYARFKGKTLEPGKELSFADKDRVSAWAADAVRWAVSEGLIVGRGENTLAPAGGATRAESAAILVRFINKIK